jgi:hypothetical protein
MNIDEICGIAVTITLIAAVAMFVALLWNLNHGPTRNTTKRTEA